MKKQTVLIGCGILAAVLSISISARSGEYVHTTATLSEGRSGMGATSVGNLAIFAGGSGPYAYSDVVDFYDADSGAWTAGSLSVARTSVAGASVGDLAFFAGGRNDDGVSDVVDIYDASTGSWTTANLSVPRNEVQAATVGDLVLFAGGKAGVGSDAPISDVVDIYDAGTGTWSTTTMPQPAVLRAGTSAGTTFVFGGHEFYGTYDTVTGTWDWRDGTLIIDSGCSLGDQAVLTSGWGDSIYTGWDDKVYLYDGTTSQWSDASDTCPYHSRGEVTALGRAVFVPTVYDGYVVGDLDWGEGPPVNSGEFDLVRAYWGQTVMPGTQGDWSGDGVVNSTDLDLVRAAWGNDPGMITDRDIMNVLDLDTGTWTTEPMRTTLTGGTRSDVTAVTVGDTALFAGGGYTVVDIYTPAPAAVPEPSAWLAVACLIGACGLWRRR